jgi:hypothetical protein
MGKNSCCYNCPDHTGTCRATCPFAKAEQLQHEYDRRERLIAYLGYYDSGLDRQALREIQANRTGGRG